MNEETKNKWFAILWKIGKYALATILGGVGVAVSGCACVPCFNF